MGAMLRMSPRTKASNSRETGQLSLARNCPASLMVAIRKDV